MTDACPLCAKKFRRLRRRKRFKIDENDKSLIALIFPDFAFSLEGYICYYCNRKIKYHKDKAQEENSTQTSSTSDFELPFKKINIEDEPMFMFLVVL